MLLIKLYIQELTNFLRTATLKNSYFATQSLDNVSPSFRENLAQQHTPYYRHLNGDYILPNLYALRRISGTTSNDESVLSELAALYGLSTVINADIVRPNNQVYTKFDELVFVNSHDDQTLIPFTRKALSYHTKTAAAYKIPSSDYINLITRYPTQADIIKNVLYPIPSISQAIDAPNYTLLQYDVELLNVDERPFLLSALEDMLTMIRVRWDVKEFVYEDLYAVAAQSIVWTMLLLTLLKQRILNIRTEAAHSYHIWEFLKSHGIGNYKNVLSTKQQMFLYRNIDYLLKHKGTSRNFILLIHKLLSEWNIGVYGKNIQQQLIGIDSTGTINNAIETCALIPNITSVRIGAANLTKLKQIDRNAAAYLDKTKIIADEIGALNITVGDVQEFRGGTIEQLDDLILKEVASNVEYENLNERRMGVINQKKLFSATPHTTLPTKIVEIRQDVTLTLEQQMYIRYVTETMLYLTTIPGFNPSITITPHGAQAPITLTYKQAVLLLYYATIRERGFTPLSLLQYRTRQGIIDFTNASTDPEANASAKLWPKRNQAGVNVTNDIPTYADLTRPLKTTFPAIPEKFIWNNNTYESRSYLQISPNKLVISGIGLPVVATNEPYLLKVKPKKKDWRWSNGTYTLSFTDGIGWFLTPRTSTYPTYRIANKHEYTSWWQWNDTWYQGTSEKTVINITVSEHAYIIDEILPPTQLTTVTQGSNLLTTAMQLVNKQACGLIQLYHETYRVASSQTDALVTRIRSDRVYQGMLPLNLTKHTTFNAFFNSVPAIKEIIQSLETTGSDENPEQIRAAYGLFSTDLIQAIFPITPEYQLDSTSTENNRFFKLKELLTSLCSYNISIIGTVVGTDSVIMPLPLRLTTDLTKVRTTIRTHAKLPVIDVMPSWKDRKNNTHRGSYLRYIWHTGLDIQSAIVWNLILERAKLLYGNVVDIDSVHTLEAEVKEWRSIHTYTLQCGDVGSIVFDANGSNKTSAICYGVLLPHFHEDQVSYAARLLEINQARNAWFAQYQYTACHQWLVKYAFRLNGPTGYPPSKWWFEDFGSPYGFDLSHTDIQNLTEEWLLDNSHRFLRVWQEVNSIVTDDIQNIFTDEGYAAYINARRLSSQMGGVQYDSTPIAPGFLPGPGKRYDTVTHQWVPADGYDYSVDPVLTSLYTPITIDNISSFFNTYPHNRTIEKQFCRFDSPSFAIVGSNTTTYVSDDGPIEATEPLGAFNADDPYWSFSYVKDGVSIQPTHYPTYNIVLLGIDPVTKLPIVTITGS